MGMEDVINLLSWLQGKPDAYRVLAKEFVKRGFTAKEILQIFKKGEKQHGD